MESSARSPYQFRLRSLIVAVTVCALALGATRWLGWASAPFAAASVCLWVAASWKVKHYFVWLAPTLFAACAYGSWRHPGDEYGMFGVAVLPALWLAPLLEFVELKEVVGIIIGAGTAIVAVVGFVLDRLPVHRRSWTVCYLVFGGWLLTYGLNQYESLERAISKNGSIAAYVFCAANLSLDASLLLFLLGGGIVAVVRRIRRSRRNTSS